MKRIVQHWKCLFSNEKLSHTKKKLWLRRLSKSFCNLIWHNKHRLEHLRLHFLSLQPARDFQTCTMNASLAQFTIWSYVIDVKDHEHKKLFWNSSNSEFSFRPKFDTTATMRSMSVDVMELISLKVPRYDPRVTWGCPFFFSSWSASSEKWKENKVSNLIFWCEERNYLSVIWSAVTDSLTND